MKCEFEDKVFSVTEQDFTDLAVEVFHFQYAHNPLYRQYADQIGRVPGRVRRCIDIPFLPISFFKSHAVKTGDWTPEMIFESSTTTGNIPSRHLVKDLGMYEQSFLKGFQQVYGDPREWCIIGLLPSYLERKHSSLVYMVDHLMRLSQIEESGFYLYDHEKLVRTLEALEQRGQKTLLFGVTFALIDFAQEYPLSLKHTVVIETGGMKGRKEERTRSQVHELLTRAFGASVIHSEYGMTELLSQAYSGGHGLFHCPPWMKVLVREEDDPMTIMENGNARGGLNVIDLANLYSCSFIATEDVGRSYADGTFEVLGRIDHSEIRGCSLMMV